MPSHRPIDKLAEAATQEYLRRSSIAFHECAVNLMLTHLSKDEVYEILRQTADMVEEFD